MSKQEYSNAIAAYTKASGEVRAKLTSVSVVIIGAIYFASKEKDLLTLKLALFSFLVTMILEIISSYFKVLHFSLWIDGKIKNTDFRESWWGKFSHWLFYLAAIPFALGFYFFTRGFLGI